MAHLPYFPAIKRYETLSTSDYWMFYPQIEGKTKATNYSIDSLPRKVEMSTMLTFIGENISGVPAALAIQDEGVSLGTNFTVINFIGPLVTAADAGSNVASVTITGTLMSSFTDVSTDFYASTTAWFTNTRTVWNGNEPSQASAGDWLSNWNTATFVMVWNPVNNEWMPIPAFDIVDNLAGASENIYNVSGQLISNRIVDLENFSLAIYDVTSGTALNNNSPIRLHNHRILAGDGASGDGTNALNIGWYAQAGGTASDCRVDFYSNSTGTAETGRILQKLGATGDLEIASFGGVTLQAGGMAGTSKELRLLSTGLVTIEQYKTSGTPYDTSPASLFDMGLQPFWTLGTGLNGELIQLKAGHTVMLPHTGATGGFITNYIGKTMYGNRGTDITLTVPANNSQFEAVLGDKIHFVQHGVGQIIIAAAAGVTILSYSSGDRTAGQYAHMELLYTDDTPGAEEWVLSGQTNTAIVTDTNFAITDLTATGNRTHDFAQFDLTIDDVNDYTLNAEGEVVISAHDSAQHSIKSITAGTQESWFIRAYDGTDAITVQVIADSVGGSSQFEIGTASTGAPIIFDTDGYVQVDGQVAQSGEFRIEGLSGAHYMGVKVDSTAGGAATYTLTYPNAIGASNQIFTHDGTGAITLLTEGAHIAVQGTTLAVVPDEEFDLGAFSIGGTAQSATGDGTTTINWGTGNMFNFQFGAFSETFSFTAPTNPGTFILKLVQDGTGSRTATWPGTVKWPEGTAPTLTTTATTGTDIITFYYDGTSYFAVSTLNFS